MPPSSFLIFCNRKYVNKAQRVPLFTFSALCDISWNKNKFQKIQIFFQKKNVLRFLSLRYSVYFRRSRLVNTKTDPFKWKSIRSPKQVVFTGTIFSFHVPRLFIHTKTSTDSTNVAQNGAAIFVLAFFCLLAFCGIHKVWKIVKIIVSSLNGYFITFKCAPYENATFPRVFSSIQSKGPFDSECKFSQNSYKVENCSQWSSTSKFTNQLEKLFEGYLCVFGTVSLFRIFFYNFLNGLSPFGFLIVLKNF